jgi:hypothetical protein
VIRFALAVVLIPVAGISAGCLGLGTSSTTALPRGVRIAKQVERIRPGDLPPMRNVRCTVTGRVATCTGGATLVDGSYTAVQDFLIERDGSLRPRCPSAAAMPTIFCGP